MSEHPVYVKYRKDAPLVIGDVQAAAMSDLKHMKIFGDEVIETISKYKGLALLLNFESVHYLSSAALTELIRIRETVRTNGGALRLCGLSPDIFKVFEITKLDKDFGVRAKESCAQAVARFKRDISASPAAAAKPATG